MKNTTATAPRALAGSVVAITGGGRGIGAATAEVLARRGAKVAIGDLDLDVAEATAQRIGGGTVAVRLDVTDPKSFASFLDETEEKLGPLDVLINNAGIMPLATLLEEDDAMTARMLDLNVRALISGSREAARRMVPRRSGHIINIASTAGKLGLPGGATYCATKSAVIGFSEGIEQELAEHGVHVSIVMPGIVQTELAVGVPDLPGFKSVTPQAVAEGIAEAIVTPRLEVFVPRSAGPMLKYTRLMPRRSASWLSGKMGVDKVFLSAHADPGRKAYEERAAGHPEAGGNHAD
jgi:NAD(P)-dependent dehydrogenase (short-subunit alcohol dehydrogenase family)